MLFTQKLAPQTFVCFSVAGNTKALDKSASSVKHVAMLETACCVRTE